MNKVHKVTFTNTGASYNIEQGESIVKSSNNQGASLPFSCMQGMCTTCVAKIIDGDFKYIEEPELGILTESEIKNNVVLLCVATPITDLTISSYNE
ncbi:(2Fe-2S)-binding protein [bacterium]|jgi:ferredoxin|nr:(2Fe-2S)-binding protein [bacterium]MBT3795467.1 (2Fe-2S)-binding protein [bacterium]MBT4634787.1 (2Fe-2S)-binding protein [bacterium]